MSRDPSLDTLLDLDGTVLVVDPDAKHWVRFVVTRVDATEAKPHGLDYSLTLHGPDGERLVGFDNAHSIRQRSGPSGSGAARRTTSIEDMTLIHCRYAGDRGSWPEVGIARCHHEGKLWELGIRRRDGISRAIYVIAADQPVVIARVFAEQTQKAPNKELRLSRQKTMDVR